MKALRLYLFLCTLLSAATLIAQQALTTDVAPVYTSVRQWQPAVVTDSVFTWPFAFGEDSAQAELLIRLLKNQYVTKIQLVYSRYSMNKNFDQQTLNRQRLQRLSALHPEWFDPQSGIEWEFVEQTGCASAKGCSGYFHGFVFYYMSRAKANALFHRNLMIPRRAVDRMEEIEAFNYWFDQNINKDKKYTALPTDTGQSPVDALNRPETADQQQQRVEQIIKEVQEAKTVKQDLRADEKKEKETTSAAKSDTKRTEENKKALDTKEQLVSNDQKPAKETKNEEAPAPSKAKEQDDKNETPTAQKHRGRSLNKKGKRSTVLDVYYSISYPKKKAHGPTWTQYAMELLRKRKENVDGWIEWMTWNGHCDSINCKTCIPPPPDTNTCKDCFIWRSGSRRILTSDGTVPASMQRLSARNSHMNVVGDVTLGMLGTMQDLINWAADPRNAVQVYKGEFYNDGDNTPDMNKVIGKTGGLHPVDVCSSGRTGYLDILYGQERLFGSICHAARAGDGGDVPENAIEACRDAEGRCANCDAQVLIADNRSPVRDISLLDNITQPLQIILPFVKRERGLINTEYLDMARQTHGVIHILERAYYDLDKMKDGDTLKIYEYKYLLQKDHFICIEVSREPLTE